MCCRQSSASLGLHKGYSRAKTCVLEGMHVRVYARACVCVCTHDGCCVQPIYLYVPTCPPFTQKSESKHEEVKDGQKPNLHTPRGPQPMQRDQTGELRAPAPHQMQQPHVLRVSEQFTSAETLVLPGGVRPHHLAMTEDNSFIIATGVSAPCRPCDVYNAAQLLTR